MLELMEEEITVENALEIAMKTCVYGISY